jgi:Flp pilus assembly protein TadG
MRCQYSNSSPRRGAIAVLVAVLLIPLLAMMAFSVDIGYILVVKSDLQNAADSAALAGAEQLQNLYVLYTLPGQTQQSQIMTKATTNTGASDCPTFVAEQFAHYNIAGRVAINVPDSDVVMGYTDVNGNYSATLNGHFPNTIDVTTRRQGDPGSPTNGSLQLFFAPVLGMTTRDLQATARATIYAGDISSFKVISGIDSHVLPVGLDVNVWQQFYQTGVSSDGQIYAGPNGAPQLQVYPNPGTAPGNFGLLDVGPPANNAPAFRRWIDDGQTPNDISYLLTNNLLPVSTTSPSQWKAGPGLKSTLLSDFQLEIGKPNLIPLFQPVSTSPYQAASGSGSNTYYSIVGFVGVEISAATGSGTSMNISIQPMAVIDATSVIGNAQPAGTQSSSFGTTTTTFISAKLMK